MENSMAWAVACRSVDGMLAYELIGMLIDRIKHQFVSAQISGNDKRAIGSNDG
jgi:hypothetical protein